MKKRAYIMHLDGDSFFAAVEAAKNPKLRGRAVVTGQERGIASAMSYEAKKLGITRAMPIFQIRKLFPEVAVVSSDYESYAIYSRRIFDIVKRYADTVEEYSIDECFADFTGRPDIARNPRPVLEKIKSDIRRELGISVSLGLGPTKVIAKTASKRNKPNGLTILAPEEVPEALSKIPVDDVWGIGSATAFSLRKHGVSTALELARKPLSWVEERFSKPLCEMWHELNCVAVYQVKEGFEVQKSIMKTRTFSPASRDKAYVFSELSKNVENAARKARDLGLAAWEISVYLKTKDFEYKKGHSRLSAPVSGAFDLVAEAARIFESIFDKTSLYRATGVVLCGLQATSARQEDLFGNATQSKGRDELFETVDRVNGKYGAPVIHLASSDRAIMRKGGSEDVLRFIPRGFRKRLSIPYLGECA